MKPRSLLLALSLLLSEASPLFATETCRSYTFEKLSLAPLDPDLDEMSGLILGGLGADTLVHIRDSGNDPLLIYTKRDGTVIARYPFADKATDPEEIARGECPWGGSCLYVFDTGDNFHWRSQRHIWAVEESTLRSPAPRSQKLDFQFPGGEKLDVEGAVLAGKTFYFFAKEPKHSRVFALDMSAWNGGSTEAAFVTDLPFTMITGASASKDGSRILLINWQGAREIAMEGTGTRADGTFYPYRRLIKLRDMEQQEGISYDTDQRSFLYSSEKKLVFSKKNYGIMRASCVPSAANLR